MQANGLTITPQQKEISNIKNNSINNRNTNNTISIPISITRTSSKNQDLNLTEQYSLVANIFDPSKMSPPDHWKDRLEKRLKDHNLVYKKNTTFTNNFYISENANE